MDNMWNSGSDKVHVHNPVNGKSISYMLEANRQSKSDTSISDLFWLQQSCCEFPDTAIPCSECYFC